MGEIDSAGPGRFKRWTQLGTVAVAGLAMASAGMAATGRHDHQALKSKAAGVQLAAASEGGEGGEGGEGKPDGSIEVEAMYLVGIGQLEGHLRAGMELYRQGRADLAKPQMRHPGDQLYTHLKRQIDYRHANDFATELASFAAAVEGDRPQGEIEAAFADLMKEMGEAREKAGGGDGAVLLAAAMLVRQAGSDYAKGVKDGSIAELDEYQDAWGLIEAARWLVLPLGSDGNQSVAAAAQRIIVEIDGLKPAFPGLVPDATIPADASVIYGAGARIMLAAQSVK